MKRILAVLLMVVLVIAVMPATSLAAGAVSNGKTKLYHVQTNSGNLNLRSGPGTKYRTIASLPKGTALIKKGSSGNWWKVKTANGLLGWVDKKYVKSDAYVNVVTKESGLNVRKGPGTGYAWKFSLPHGTKRVTVTEMSGNWAHVYWRGMNGWASLSYLRWTR